MCVCGGGGVAEGIQHMWQGDFALPLLGTFLAIYRGRRHKQGGYKNMRDLHCS